MKFTPYREVKRKLEAAGFAELSQKVATSSLPNKRPPAYAPPLCRITAKLPLEPSAASSARQV
jgi:hypothetical protein